MEPSKVSAPLTQFLTSLKEVEEVLRLRQAPNTHETDKGIPIRWREVVHMARVAPALIDSVKGCKSGVDDIIVSLESSQTDLKGISMAELRNLSEYCSRIVRLAEQGAGREGESIH